MSTAPTTTRLPSCPSCGGGVRKVRPGGVCHRCVPATHTAPAAWAPVPPTHLAPLSETDETAESAAPESGVRLGELVSVPNVSIFGELAEFEVTAGVFDEDARHALMNGQCHALAVALHDATGWPIGALYTVNHDADMRRGWTVDPMRHGAEHLFVFTPSGGILDARGHRDVEDLYAEIGSRADAAHLITLTREQAHTVAASGAMPAPAYEVAATFVPAVLSHIPAIDHDEPGIPDTRTWVRRTRAQAERDAAVKQRLESTEAARRYRAEIDRYTEVVAEQKARLTRISDPTNDGSDFDDADWDAALDPAAYRTGMGYTEEKLRRAGAQLSAALADPGPFAVGQSVVGHAYSGHLAGQRAVIIPASHVPMDREGQVKVEGYYRPFVDWAEEVAVRYPDGRVDILAKDWLTPAT